MTDRIAVNHLIAGGIGGTVGASVTCPLEVVKVRLQSSAGCSASKNGGGAQKLGSAFGGEAREALSKTSRPNFQNALSPDSMVRLASTCSSKSSISTSSSRTFLTLGHCVCRNFSTQPPKLIEQPRLGFMIWGILKNIVKTEGLGALWKGIGPNIVGVAPSKATYFYAYSTSKRFLNEIFVPNSPWVHMTSAGFAGFLAATVVNPIWLVKTRLQLDRRPGKPLTLYQVISRVFKNEGLGGFYKGVTASYAGISETIIQFVLYEYLRAIVIDHDSPNRKMDFPKFMACGGGSKLLATVLVYPHEVVRTRLREEGSQYRGFWHCLTSVARESGWRGLYRGMAVHLLRTIPNTAITMGTYELVVSILARL